MTWLDKALRRGARRLHDALLSKTAVERAARGIHASHDRGDWNEERPEVKDAYRDTAIAALTAAIGEEGDDE